MARSLSPGQGYRRGKAARSRGPADAPCRQGLHRAAGGSWIGAPAAQSNRGIAMNRGAVRTRRETTNRDSARLYFLRLPDNRYCACGCGRRADTVLGAGGAMRALAFACAAAERHRAPGQNTLPRHKYCKIPKDPTSASSPGNIGCTRRLRRQGQVRIGASRSAWLRIRGGPRQ
jgi:hypothetical protein